MSGKTCPLCGAVNEVKSKFCSECGTALDKIPEEVNVKPNTDTNTIGFIPNGLKNALNMKIQEKVVDDGSSFEPETPNTTIVADFCKRTVATVGGDGYSETILYRCEDGSEQIDFYSEYENQRKYHKINKLDKPISDLVIKKAEELGFKDWKPEDCMPGMCGGVVIFKYFKDGEMIRVTSERAPGDGVSKMYEMNNFICSFIPNKDE